MSRVLTLFLLLLPVASYSQETFRGTPYIRNFHKSDYKADTQNWGISQDKRGFIYFANNDGLLSFDGVEWNLTRVSESSPLRSILVDSKDRILVGLINDFGIVNRTGNKPSSFTSLKKLLPEDYREFNEIWRIHEVSQGILFQCYEYIFLYDGNQIKVIEPGTRFRFSFQTGSKVYVHEPGVGIYQFAGDHLEKLPWWNFNHDKEIISVLEADAEKLFVCTTNDGVFIVEDGLVRKWEAAVNELLLRGRLYSAVRTPDGGFAFGTILNGMVITDSEGNIRYAINNQNGMQNNTILSLFVDNSENLWLGLDNGIDFVEINSPLSYIGSDKIGTGYCCRVFEGNLYLGTNQGLYMVPYKAEATSADPELVEKTAGQVWTLEEFGGQLFCGHNQGTYLINGRKAEKICNEEGAWKFIPVNGRPDLVIGGHYNGLLLFRRINGRWEYDKKIKGFEESSRYLFQDAKGFLWIGHSGKGIFRLSLNESCDSVTEIITFNDRGLASGPGNILFRFDNRIYVSTLEEIVEFDDANNRFIPSGRMNDLFGNSGKIKFVAPDVNGYTWFIAESESGYLRHNEDMTYTRVTVPLRKLRGRFVNEFEFLYPFDGENIYMGIENGFVNYDPSVPKMYNREFSAYITRVELSYPDSVLYLWDEGNNKEFKFPWKRNSFRFYYASPFFENDNPLMFSYFLDGFTDEWSDWSNEEYKDFTNLHEGKYVLSLKAKNIYGVESEPDYFQFEILPPWRRSAVAYIIYLLIISALLFLVIKYILYRAGLAALKEKEKHRKELEDEKYRHHQEALLSEKKLTDLKNEKLRTEMVFRDRELANQTMAIIEKNKFLKRISDELNSIQDFVVNDQARAKMTGLKRKITREIDIKQQNKIFEDYFDAANEELFRRLKEKFPDLTPYDLRICAFIRMNIPTKEIAAILNISYRGAEVSRYRLRKKMQLSRDVNLSSYLAGF